DEGVVILFDVEDEKSLKIPTEYANSPVKSDFLGLLKSYIVRNRLKYLGAIILLGIGLFANWLMPIIFQRILDEGIEKNAMQVVYLYLSVQVVLFVSNFISEFISEKTLTKINFYLSVRLKEDFLKKLMRLPISYFDT